VKNHGNRKIQVEGAIQQVVIILSDALISATIHGSRFKSGHPEIFAWPAKIRDQH
jgi:hypothetical protein